MLETRMKRYGLRMQLHEDFEIINPKAIRGSVNMSKNTSPSSPVEV